MNKTIRKNLRKAANYLPTSILNKLEFDRRKFIGLNERPVEFSFVFKCIATVGPKSILDVGSGTTALPHLMSNCGAVVTAIDNIRDYWPSGMKNRHYHILDKDITASDLHFDEQFDLVTCISVLEHIKNHEMAMKNMFNVLNPGGHLVLTCPYTENEYLEDAYRLPESKAYHQKIPFVCQSYSRVQLNKWIADNDCEIVEQEYWHLFEGNRWGVGERIIPSLRTSQNENHQLTCLLIKKKG